jgi:predicted O-linked N-acetylglucosamine transferase (SPINDLY family)
MSIAEIDQHRARLVAEMARMRAAGLRLADPLRHASSALFYTAYQGRNDRELKRAFAQFHLAATPGLAWEAPHCAGYAGHSGRIRVGFVSKFLYPEHPIGKYYSAIIDQLDLERFDVTEFRVASARDSGGGTRSQTAIPRDDLAASRQAVAAARLDVLFYPEIGMDPATYFLAFARLAPVQCTTLGHPVTTGIPAVDYFLSGDALETAEAQDHYSETLIRLAAVPHYFLQRTPSGAAAMRAELGIAPDARLYACGQNPIKIHPEFDPVLADILRRDPKAALALFNGDKTERWGELLKARFRRTMPDVAARVTFLPFLKLDAWLGFLQQADAVLDTPHFAGGTTSLELFALGVPIVTWPGAYARSRQTQAYYRQMGIAGPIASSADEYVELALRLASDAPWRRSLGDALRERAPVLYENRAAVRELEDFFAAAAAAAASGRRLQRWPA